MINNLALLNPHSSHQHSPCFFDTHCHFDAEPFAVDTAAAWQSAQAAGVSKIVVPSTGPENFSTVLALTRYLHIYAALGIHPHTRVPHLDTALAQLQRLLQQQLLSVSELPTSRKVVALGEIGLDAVVLNQDMDAQYLLLRRQLRLANQFKLPVILHSRQTHDLLLRELRQYPVERTGVLHAFSGSREQALAFIRLGYSIGVGGVITYPRANKTRAAIAALPLSALVLETDAPYMPVCGRQGEPNCPERLVDVFAALCELRSESPQEIAESVYKNSMKLFDITVNASD
ncbi:TatD family hydrolase [Plesiomonas sp.]|uniref:TatD family hydrolase n=1 Tax=Plesiomonas sp. TaxID=2486279 RepID=UPI003F3D2B0F